MNRGTGAGHGSNPSIVKRMNGKRDWQSDEGFYVDDILCLPREQAVAAMIERYQLSLDPAGPDAGISVGDDHGERIDLMLLLEEFYPEIYQALEAQSDE